MASKDTCSEPSSLEAQPKDEEHLPVYYSSGQADSNTLPASQAFAEEIRQFIIRVLVSRRQLPIYHARRVAARWNVGSGLELRTYPASMYSELFGSEDGWILYKEIKPMIDAETQKKAIDRYGPDTTILALFGYFVTCIAFISLNKDSLSFMMGLLGMLVSGLGLVMMIKMAVSARSSGEKAIGDLQKAAERANARHS